MPKKCKPREYYTVTTEGKLTHGFRCKHFPSRRFTTLKAMREAKLEHQKESKRALDS